MDSRVLFSQAIARISSVFFGKWFYKNFVLDTKKFLVNKRWPRKAILFISNETTDLQNLARVIFV